MDVEAEAMKTMNLKQTWKVCDEARAMSDETRAALIAAAMDDYFEDEMKYVMKIQAMLAER